MEKTFIYFFKNYFFGINLLAFFFLAVLAMYPSVTFAEEQSQFTEMARERQYPGGRDESDLKVQQKTTSSSKAKPADNQESNEGF